MKSASFGLIVALTLNVGVASTGHADETNHPDPYTQGYLDTVSRQHQVLDGLISDSPNEETRDYIRYAQRALYVTPGSEFDVSFNEWKDQMVEGRAAIAAHRAAHPELLNQVPKDFLNP